MLATQVQYWNYKEGQRHNIASENLQQQSINETIRHNVKTEGQTDFYNAEVARHNQVQETLGFKTLAETARHNRAQESIGYQQAAASQLSAKASYLGSQAAMRNAETNEFLSISQSSLNQSSTKYNNAKTWKVPHDVTIGYGNTAVRAAEALGRLIPTLGKLKQTKIK